MFGIYRKNEEIKNPSDILMDFLFQIEWLPQTKKD